MPFVWYGYVKRAYGISSPRISWKNEVDENTVSNLSSSNPSGLNHSPGPNPNCRWKSDWNPMGERKRGHPRWSKGTILMRFWRRMVWKKPDNALCDESLFCVYTSKTVVLLVHFISSQLFSANSSSCKLYSIAITMSHSLRKINRKKYRVLYEQSAGWFIARITRAYRRAALVQLKRRKNVIELELIFMSVIHLTL